MSDLFVVIAVLLAISWAASIALFIASRFERSFRFINSLFLGPRGALFAPPVFGALNAIYLFSCHRSLFPATSNLNITKDDDGCVHGFVHEDRPVLIFWIFVFATLVSCSILIFVKRARATADIRRRLVASINRRATRSLRHNTAANRGDARICMISKNEMGPLAIFIKKRIFIKKKKYIFVPENSFRDAADLRAILAHELSHFQRRHFERRFLMEVILAIPAPWFLLKNYISAARAEDEYEADDDAVRAVGSPISVATAILHAAENAAATHRANTYVLRAMGDTDITTRIRRLIEPCAPRRRTFISIPLSLSLATGVTAIAVAAPVIGVWTFCYFESLLGVSCF